MKMSASIGSLLMVSVLSCRQSPGPKESDSELTATSMCRLSRPVGPNHPVPRTGSVTPPSVKRLPAVPNGQAPTAANFGISPENIPPVYSKESTVFGVEIEIPRTGYIMTSNTVQASFGLTIADKLRHCSLGLSSWKWNEFNRFVITDNARTPQSIEINIGKDPAVVEITTTPLTYAQTESWQNVLDELIFATAQELESKDLVGSPNYERNRWSGHINVSWPGLMTSMATDDAKALKEINWRIKEKYHLTTADIERANMDLVLNFFTNMQNFPVLSMGLLGGDVRNAAPLALGSKQEQDILRKIIEDYKSHHINSLVELANRINKADPVSFRGKYGSSHYTLVNLESIIFSDYKWGLARGTRLELRGFFSPLSVNEMLANYRIVIGMLDYVHRNYRLKDGKVMAYQPLAIDENFKKYATTTNFKVQGLTGGLTPGRAAEVYLTILKQAGLDPTKEYVYLRDTIIREAVKKRLECQGGAL